MLADAGSVHTQRWVQAFVVRGLEVAVWSERDWPEAPAGVKVIRLPAARRGRVNLGPVSVSIRRDLKRYRPDVVHAHYVSRYGLYGALAGYRPLVMSVWGGDVEVFPSRLKPLTSTVLRFVLARADRVTATSRYLAGVTGWFTAKPVTVVPFGIDLGRFRPAPPGTGPLRWVVNKALEWTYGIDSLFEALSRLPRELPWSGRIIGTGSQAGELAALARRLNLADRIGFLGRVAADNLPEQLAWADIGVYPSRRESFGVAPLEMMALGRAVIANRTGGLPEVVDDGATGILVEAGRLDRWADVLREAAENPEKFRRMGEAGPSWVARHFDFAVNVEQMLTVYRQVLR